MLWFMSYIKIQIEFFLVNIFVKEIEYAYNIYFSVVS